MEISVFVIMIMEVHVVVVKLFGLELAQKKLMEELFMPLDLPKNILMVR